MPQFRIMLSIIQVALRYLAQNLEIETICQQRWMVISFKIQVTINVANQSKRLKELYTLILATDTHFPSFCSHQTFLIKSNVLLLHHLNCVKKATVHMLCAICFFTAGISMWLLSLILFYFVSQLEVKVRNFILGWLMHFRTWGQVVTDYFFLLVG